MARALVQEGQTDAAKPYLDRALGIDDSLGRIHYFRSPTIIDRQTQSRSAVGGAQIQCRVHFSQHTIGYTVSPSDDADYDILFHDRLAFLDHVLLEQMHEKIEFVLGAFPVLAGETIQCQLFDFQPSALFDGPAYTGNTAAVSLNSRKVPS